MKSSLLPLRALPCVLLAAQPNEPASLPHPRNMEPLLSWISDTESPVRTVRVLPDEAFALPHEKVLDAYDRAVRHVSPDKEKGGRFGYRYLGKTKSGVTGFMTFDDGGGSGVFCTAVFVRPVSGKIARADLSGKFRGEVTLPVSEYSGYSLLLDQGCGDRSVHDTRIDGERVDFAIVNPREPLPPNAKVPEIFRSSYDLSEPSRH